jgi:phosphoglycolate phosphatase-like HAD superfamily hydrolase
MPGPAVIVLDFDGVILESVGVKTLAFQAAFADRTDAAGQRRIAEIHLGNPGLTRFEKFRLIHEELIGTYDGRRLDARLDAEFSAAVRRGTASCPFVPGALELLREQAALRPLFVASAAPEAELREIVAERGITDVFRAVHGAPRRKPEILAAVLAEQGIHACEALFIGDAPADQEAAAAVGVPFVGRYAGPESPPLREEGALAIVADLDDLRRRWPQVARAHDAARAKALT